MSDARAYWGPVCELVHKLRCWVRMGWWLSGTVISERWGQLLLVPVDGYLEGPDGPVPFRDVELLEISTKRIRLPARRPYELIDVTDDLVAGMRTTRVIWQLRETTWSYDDVFTEQPVTVVHIVNPFRAHMRDPGPKM